jgi:hypothetical protein
MSGVFISYRREDSAEDAHHLYRALSERFGADSVFIDVEDIGPGEDFAQAIDEKVGFCDALVAVIGRKWATCTDAAGRRRLDDPADWVRLEIEAALAREMKVFPVLVGGAALPEARALPASLAALAQHQALELDAARFERDVGRLTRALEWIRKGQGLGALWMSIITRGHTALDPLALDKPETLWRALQFLVLMLAVVAVLHLPAVTIPGAAYVKLGYLLAYVAADYVQWLGAGLVLHVAMKTVGGRATFQKSLAAFCFLAAYLPLIAVAQIPVWGLNVAVVREAADLAWDPAQGAERMRAFAEGLGAFGIARVVLSFLVATYLWWRFLAAVFRGFRALHRLSTPRALLGLGLGLGAMAVFVAVVVMPYFGTVYGRFTGTVPGRTAAPSGAALAAMPLDLQAQPRHLGFEESAVERRRGEDKADVARVLVRSALTEVLQLAHDHVLRRRDPGAVALQVDPAPMLERPGVQGVLSRDVDVGLELARVVNQVEHAARGARQLELQGLVRRHVVQRIGKRFAQRGDVA